MAALNETVVNNAFVGSMLVDEVHAIRALGDDVGTAHLADDAEQREGLALSAGCGR